MDRTPEPTEEPVHLLDSIVMPQEALQEHRHFVDYQQHGLVVLGTKPDQLLSDGSPIFAVHLRSEPHREVIQFHLFDVRGPGTPKKLLPACAQWDHLAHPGGEQRDHVFHCRGLLHVDEDELPMLATQTTPEFAGNACLPHSPLPGSRTWLKLRTSGPSTSSSLSLPTKSSPVTQAPVELRMPPLPQCFSSPHCI